MKKMNLILAVLLVIGLAAVPAFAAGEYGESQTGGSATGTMSQQSETPGMGQSIQSGTHRISKLMDKTVKNAQGDDLGKVEDVVLSDGKIRYVILSREDKLIPVPFQTISNSTMQEDAIIAQNLDKQKLDAAPTFSEQEWNQLSDPSFESRVFGYYGEQQPSGTRMEQRQMQQPETGTRSPGPGGMAPGGGM